MHDDKCTETNERVVGSSHGMSAIGAKRTVRGRRPSGARREMPEAIIALPPKTMLRRKQSLMRFFGGGVVEHIRSPIVAGSATRGRSREFQDYRPERPSPEGRRPYRVDALTDCVAGLFTGYCWPRLALSPSNYTHRNSPVTIRCAGLLGPDMAHRQVRKRNRLNA
jgi:hypothetical protein